MATFTLPHTCLQSVVIPPQTRLWSSEAKHETSPSSLAERCSSSWEQREEETAERSFVGLIPWGAALQQQRLYKFSYQKKKLLYFIPRNLCNNWTQVHNMMLEELSVLSVEPDSGEHLEVSSAALLRLNSSRSCWLNLSPSTLWGHLTLSQAAAVEAFFLWLDSASSSDSGVSSDTFRMRGQASSTPLEEAESHWALLLCLMTVMVRFMTRMWWMPLIWSGLMRLKSERTKNIVPELLRESGKTPPKDTNKKRCQDVSENKLCLRQSS